MANVTGVKPIRYYGTPTKVDVPVEAAATYYAGQLVFRDLTHGYAVQTPASQDTFIGVCAETVTVSAAGDLIPVYVAGVFGFKISGAAVTHIARPVVADASGVTNNPDDLVTLVGLTDAADDQIIGQCVTVIDSYAYVSLGTTYPVYYSSTDAIGYIQGVLS